MASLDDMRDLSEGIELSDEMLEGISGGTLNKLQEGLLDALIKDYRERGQTADDLIAWMQKTGEGHYEVNPNGIWRWDNGIPQDVMGELTEYANQHW